MTIYSGESGTLHNNSVPNRRRRRRTGAVTAANGKQLVIGENAQGGFFRFVFGSILRSHVNPQSLQRTAAIKPDTGNLQVVADNWSGDNLPSRPGS